MSLEIVTAIDLVPEHDCFGNREVDDEPSHIDQRCHKRRRCTGRVEATSPQDERKHRPRKRAECHHTDERAQDRQGKDRSLWAVGFEERLPDKDASEPDDAENDPSR